MTSPGSAVRPTLPLVLVLLVASFSTAVAQTSAPIPIGTRVRVTLGDSSRARLVGVFEGLEGDRFLLREPRGASVSLPADSVWWVQRSLGRFNERRALIFAAAGIGSVALSTATVALTELATDGRVTASRGDIVPLLLLGGGAAVTGAAIGGAGSRAAAGGAVAGGVGAVVGAAWALSEYERCSPDAWICIDFGPGFTAFAGALAGGIGGFVLGSVVGALTPGELWDTPVALDLQPDPSGGVALSAHVRF